MKKCSRVKNPCKFCLQTVTEKTGVQCKGACKKWAHFTCLNYTPGKIHDIKKGIIKITCPCPNCNTQDPKEYLTNPPFTCTNQECPANKAPQCQQSDCPLNAGPKKEECGKACKASRESRFTPPTSSPEMIKIPPACPKLPEVVPPCLSQPIVNDPPSKMRCPPMAPPPVSDCAVNKPCPRVTKSASCSSLAGYGNAPIRHLVETGNQGCVESDASRKKALKAGDCKLSCSDSNVMGLSKGIQKHLFGNIHQLCTTVGELSNQIKELMCKMMYNLE